MSFGGASVGKYNAASAFVAKLDGSGNHVWSKGFGTFAVGFGVATDAATNVFFTGYFQGTIDFGSGPLVGRNPVNGGNAFNVFLAKLAP
jgi:hypothetical protein